MAVHSRLAERGGRPHPREYYSGGATTVFASRHDQRFSFCAYVPSAHDPDGVPVPLAVLQHGTGRRGPQYRDHFAEWAERNGCLVLCPLFPAGIGNPEDLHNFKFIEYGDIRYDEILLEIVAEAGDRWHTDTSAFLLHGFSGGGQFAHRFAYLHPERLRGVSIGAPGRITYLDADRPWWVGLGGFEAKFGRPPQLARLREVPVQMVVGAEDTETWEINNVGDTNWMDGADAHGTTRLERLRALGADFERHGIAVRFDVVPGVGHQPMHVLEPVKEFFTSILEGRAR